MQPNTQPQGQSPMNQGMQMQPQGQQQPMMPPMQPQMMPMQQQPIYQPMPAMQSQQMPYGYPQQQPMPNGMVPAGQTQTTTTINIVTARGNEHNILTCSMILCQCIPPQFDSCQGCCGCCTAFSPGSGLAGGACCGCYGCDKPDCCSVWCAGFGMSYTSPCIFGIVSACMVGWKMMLGEK